MFAMDSKYSIGVLDQGHRTKTNSTIVTELHRRIQLLSNKGRRRIITFKWVKAHTGIAGNEVADRLAGRAARLANTSLPMPPLPPMIPINNDINTDNFIYPTMNDILAIYPQSYGPMDIERMLIATGHYITQLTNIRPI